MNLRPWADRIARRAQLWRIRHGFGGMAGAVQRLAREAGATLHYTGDELRLTKGADDFILPADDALELLYLLPRLETLQRRASAPLVDGRRRVPMDGPRQYKLWGSDELLWLTRFPELVDVERGYFARGAPAEGAVVFDVGAYCGEVTIPTARRVGPRGHVYAFEPDARAREFLERNLRAARVANVTVLPYGIWSETTRLTLRGPSLGASLVSNQSSADTSEIEVLSLADVCARTGVMPDFVKMDIEGAELEAISGARAVLAARSIRFGIASYHVRDGARTSVALEAMFRAAGYAVETGFPEHPTTWAWQD